MPKKETPAHARALRTARMWNQRARDKERRLERQGATNIADISPRVSPRDLPSMTTRELQRYASQLNRFVSEGYQQLPSGELVTRREVRKMKRDIRQINRNRNRASGALDAAADFPHAKTVEELRMERMRYDPNTLQPLPTRRGVGSPLDPLIVTEQPRTLSAFRARQKWVADLVHEPMSAVVERQRRSAVGMASQTGNEELVKLLGKATDFQLQYLVERMGLLDSLSYLYTSHIDLDKGRISVKELREMTEPGSYDRDVETILEDVRTVVDNLTV